MDIDEDISKYFGAARIESVPSDLAAPRYDQSNSGFEERRVRYERCKAATAIWNAADTNTGRLRALKNYQAEKGSHDFGVIELMEPFLSRASNRLPLSDIEGALEKLGLHEEDNSVLSRPEKDKLDQDGYLNLGPLLTKEQLAEMRRRYDITIEKCGTKPENLGARGIGKLVDTVVGPINSDGLLDTIFLHPRLLAAVRHILGTHFKFIGSNYHCALPGYGHQGIHADFLWGVKGTPQVVNAVWLIDEFTTDNGPTRVVPGTHRSGMHPTADLVDGEPRDLNGRVEGEIKLTGRAGCCFVYNAHLWHGGTQNRTSKLRRAQHCFFGHSEIPSSTDVPAVIERDVYLRMGQTERAILDIT